MAIIIDTAESMRVIQTVALFINITQGNPYVSLIMVAVIPVGNILVMIHTQFTHIHVQFFLRMF